MKKFVYIFLIFALLFTTFFNNAFAQEYDPAFNWNYIISDYEMFNYPSFNLSQIQQFLASQNSYLANFQDVDLNGQLKTAAEIIYNASQTYHVNPKTIITMLQKEQGLISNPNPSQKNLDWAMGYAVCDSCDLNSSKIQKYKGFGKQVDNGAGAMRYYYDNALQFSFIKKSNTAYTIDGTLVMPQNQATACLYTYTPHLRGNYTFWRLWQRYFGNPQSENTTQEKSTIQTQYMAQILDYNVAPINIKEGETGYFWVEYLNIGTATWTNEDLQNIYLMDASAKTNIPLIDTNSQFENNEQTAKYFKAYSQRTEVKPGEVLRITVPISSQGLKTETNTLMLVLDKKGWLSDTEVNFLINRTFNFEGTLIEDNIPEFISQNTSLNINLKFKNTGLLTWKQKEIYLDLPNKTKTSFNEKEVKPGQTATFNFKLKQADLKDNLLQANLYKKIDAKQVHIFASGNITKQLYVTKESLAAQVIDFQVPTDIKAGQEYYARILVKNVGYTAWQKDKLVLRSYRKISPYLRSDLYDKSWASGFAIEKIKATVKPGETYTFAFKIKAPQKISTYKQYYQLEWGSSYQEILLDGKNFFKEVTTKVASDLAKL